MELGNIPLSFSSFTVTSRVTNFVPKLPIFSNPCSLHVMPYFSPFQPPTRPQNPPLPIEIPSKTCRLGFPNLEIGGLSLLPHSEAKFAKLPKKCQNPLQWHITNVPKRHSSLTLGAPNQIHVKPNQLRAMGTQSAQGFRIAQ